MDVNQEKQWLLDRVESSLDGLIDQHESLRDRICIPMDEYLSSLHERRKIVIGLVIFVATILLGIDNLNSKPYWLQIISSDMILGFITLNVLVGIILYFLLGYQIKKTAEYRHSIVESYIGIRERMNFLKGFIIAGSRDLEQLTIPLLNRYLFFISFNAASKFIETLEEHKKFHSWKWCPSTIKDKTKQILQGNMVFVNLAKTRYLDNKQYLEEDQTMVKFLPTLKPLQEFKLSDFELVTSIS